ncbi:hypothetical protein DNTS_015075 [Danionella cerebrum]|uniref:Superoxide dismutase copper chaperone n=1 Tax=Danionella cerebrum TaxID=2873325 RepID=A0A553Q093_9TELE|nr:hypothetical protein DNTS_015075 [Danionella translucida]
MDTNRTAKLEFAVQMTCQSCVNAVKSVLEKEPGVRSVQIDLSQEQVLVETALPSLQVQSLIEATGRRAVLKGIGGAQPDLGAAVAMLSGVGLVRGVVRFLQLSPDRCLIDGTIDGLSPGDHGLHVHELGDLTQDCMSCGDHFNPFRKLHGAPDDSERVWDVIGRSLVVDSGKDDLGRGNHSLSSITGNSGERLACGIIARSAGLFQNPKQICACDGVTQWDERDRPIAGKGRKIPTDTPSAHL